MYVCRRFYMESLEEMFGIPTVRTSKRLSRVVAARLRPFGITPEQWTVLKRVSEAEYSTQKQLAERADKDQATLTKILDLLEKQNWIQRIRNPEDRRSFFIQITEDGLRLKAEVTPAVEQVFFELTSELNEQQVKIYTETLQKLEYRAEQLLQDSEDMR